VLLNYFAPKNEIFQPKGFIGICGRRTSDLPYCHFWQARSGLKMLPEVRYVPNRQQRFVI
jgi:hypothetical protein